MLKTKVGLSFEKAYLQGYVKKHIKTLFNNYLFSVGEKIVDLADFSAETGAVGKTAGGLFTTGGVDFAAFCLFRARSESVGTQEGVDFGLVAAEAFEEGHRVLAATHLKYIFLE